MASVGPQNHKEKNNIHMVINKLNEHASWYLQLMLLSHPLEELTICGRGFLKVLTTKELF